MPQNVYPLHIANAANSVRHVFVRDLMVSACIGIYDHEKRGSQPVRINIDLTVREGDVEIADRFENVVCYEEVVKRTESIVSSGHTNLVETMAEEIASACLEDARVFVARVRVEKLDAIANAGSVGVEIERTRPD
jgi:dihydroneopterin aldolase